MSLSDLTTRIGDSFAWVIDRFKRTDSPDAKQRVEALFIDNNDGDFSFAPGPLIDRIEVVTNDDDRQYTRDHTTSPIVVAHTGELDTYEDGSWSSDTLPDDYLNPERIYINTVTGKLYHCDTAGTIRRIR